MPTRAHTRRDPSKGKKEFSKHSGFTLIELMITVAVLAIITSLALPSYRSILEKRQVTKGAEELAAFLSVAKGQAVKLNEDVAVAYKITEGGWCIGYQVNTVGGDACDCNVSDNTASNFCGIDYDRNGTISQEEKRVFSSEEFTNSNTLTGIAFTNRGTSLTSDDKLIYDSVRGMLEITDAGDDTADAASLVLVSDPGGEYALNVQVDRLGRVSMCSPVSSDHKAVPGYDTCP